MIAGWLVARTGHFAIPFLAASISCLAGAASFRFLVCAEDPRGFGK
jgi:hypothetical protein